ncbi:MFS transporter [Aspergillus filifer]
MSTHTQDHTEVLVPKPPGPNLLFAEKDVTYGDWRDDLVRDGYDVVKGAVPRERAEKYADDFMSYLENFAGGLGFKRDDPTTVKEENLPIITEKGMILGYGAMHEKFVWDIRQEPGVVEAFERIYDTKDLIVSFDAINASFPNRTDVKPNKPWPHQDQDPETPNFRVMQGLVNLLPNGDGDGGLIVCKGAHNLSQEFHVEFKDEPNKIWAWTKEWYGFTEEGLAWLKNRGCEWVKPNAEPGDLILWDSRTPHYNLSPTGTTPRFCIYTCYMPATDATQEQLLTKKAAFEANLGTTHWPNALNVLEGEDFLENPLNLSTWQKYSIIVIVAAYGSMAVLSTSGLGAVFPHVLHEYPNNDPADVSDLMTYPTLFMGIGNFISMPLTLTLGRRPVFLFSLLLSVGTGLWCAFSTSLASHIGGRNLLSMAAGQSEALAPLIIQDIHFLHERSSKQGWFVGVQNIVAAGMYVATVYIVPDMGLKWWYIVVAVVNFATLIAAYFLVVETMFDRSSAVTSDTPCFQHTRRLEPDVFGPRTWKHDLRLVHGKINWRKHVSFYKETAQGICVLPIFWLLLVNGAFLGVYVYQSSTFGVILTPSPYSFSNTSLGFVQLIQAVDCLILVPVMGYGTDFIAKKMSQWRKGVFEPEYRLPAMVIPAAIVIVSCVLFGNAGAAPSDWHWMAIVAPYHMGFFAFMGVNIIAISYAIDAFPDHAGVPLMVICVGRGFISFGLSYSTVPLTETLGYDGGMNIFAIVCGVLSFMTIGFYLYGKRMRGWATKTFWPTLTSSP